MYVYIRFGIIIVFSMPSFLMYSHYSLMLWQVTQVCWHRLAASSMTGVWSYYLSQIYYWVICIYGIIHCTVHFTHSNVYAAFLYTSYMLVCWLFAYTANAYMHIMVMFGWSYFLMYGTIHLLATIDFAISLVSIIVCYVPYYVITVTVF